VFHDAAKEIVSLRPAASGIANISACAGVMSSQSRNRRPVSALPTPAPAWRAAIRTSR
jgi:hypothetical protein